MPGITSRGPSAYDVLRLQPGEVLEGTVHLEEDVVDRLALVVEDDLVQREPVDAGA